MDINSNNLRLLLYLKLSVITIGLFTFFYILLLGREILVPLTFALILAILLNPLMNFFIRLKMHRLLAITVAILIMKVVISVIFIL